jgi:Domain of unknown function (DUF4926)
MKEHEQVVLLRDVPDENVFAGDAGTIVHIHAAGDAYEVEFFNLLGDTVTVATIPRDAVRAATPKDVISARIAAE